jgi:excisionase family DNA binding protein
MSTQTSAQPLPIIFCNIPQAAKILGISRSAFYVLLSSGAIRSVSHGRRRLVEIASLREWAASLPAAEPTKAGR